MSQTTNKVNPNDKKMKIDCVNLKKSSSAQFEKINSYILILKCDYKFHY